MFMFIYICVIVHGSVKLCVQFCITYVWLEYLTFLSLIFSDVYKIIFTIFKFMVITSFTEGFSKNCIFLTITACKGTAMCVTI